MTQKIILYAISWAICASLMKSAEAFARGESKDQIDITVALDGSGQFKSVQEAIMSVPSGSPGKPVVIHIKPGTYK
jgi:pectin methylesterase-like acyl-CoA thioesterase